MSSLVHVNIDKEVENDKKWDRINCCTWMRRKRLKKELGSDSREISVGQVKDHCKSLTVDIHVSYTGIHNS